jgi:hypothetical protein
LYHYRLFFDQKRPFLTRFLGENCTFLTIFCKK